MSLFGKVTEMPWTRPGIDAGQEDVAFSGRPNKRIGLTVFLGVVTSMFFLFAVAYRERMELPDWDPITEPGILWFNTVLLVFASYSMQKTRNAAAAGLPLGNALWLSGALALAFLGGQLLAWNAMAAQGYYTMANPAYAFFYLLTAMHGLHLLGGLYVWGRTLRRSIGGAAPTDLRLTIELCAIYWHYLLLLWVVLFVLMLTT